MKKILIVAVGLIVGGCVVAQTETTTASKSAWEKLYANAARLDGQDISICGWFRAEFELCTLEPDPYSDPATAATTRIWIAPKSDVCSLEAVTSHPLTGWADVSGKFQHSNDPNRGFGHFGLSPSAIGKAVVRMRKTPCDN